MTFNIINTNKQLYTINGNNLIIDNSIKLGDVIDRLPSGLIDKKATGIGATTCELKSPRNSIIVVPTRALAYTKSQTHPDSFYLGSPYGEIKNKIKDSDINNYINSPIKYKKFLVVADSLPRLLNHIGDSVYNDYFIMIDEIDSFQSEIGYRPKMELSMEFFFRFTEGCLVSATLIDFSNPKVNALPRFVIDYKCKVTKKLNIFYGSKQTVKTVSELLKDYYLERKYWATCSTDSNVKLLVAYNSVESIMEAIALLPLEFRKKCKVLCSEKSKEKTILDNIEYYDELKKNLLPGQINFITSAYFVGIDIDEAFCPLLINDSKVQHSFLSFEKIKQIEGRCRVGIDTVYVLFSRARTNFHGQTKEVLLDKAAAQVDSISGMIQAGNTVPLKGELLRSKIEPLIDYFNPQALCKLSSNDIIEVSHLAIDNEILKDELLNVTYKSLQKFTLIAMKYDFYIDKIRAYEYFKSDQDKNVTYNYHIEKRRNIEKQKHDFIADLKSNRSKQELLKHTCSKTGNESYNFYSTLSESISEIDIAKYLENNFAGTTNTKKLQKVARCYKYYKLDINSNWKRNISNEFSIGAEYTPDEILDKIEKIQQNYGTFDKSVGRVTTKTKATQLLGEFLEIKRVQKRVSKDQRINLYKVVRDNPMDFNSKLRYSLLNTK